MVSVKGMSQVKKAQQRRRTLAGILLTLLLPPVGIVYLWRNEVFRIRGRMLLTAVATFIMAVFFVLRMPKAQIVAAVPQAGTTQAYTEAAATDVLTALSSLEEIARAQVPENTAGDSSVIQVSQERAIAQQQALLDTIVYSVHHNAKYYHLTPDCNGQNNSREVTIRQALQEGLAPCPDCNPPVYEAISSELSTAAEGEDEIPTEAASTSSPAVAFGGVF